MGSSTTGGKVIMKMGAYLIEYPELPKDWLLVEEYAKRKHYLGCLFCTKTHTPEQCEHKAKRTAKPDPRDQYRYSSYGD